MDNIFEIALESAYCDWNEPLLESDNTSVKDRVIAAVKKFYGRLKEFFKKMLEGVKKIFGKVSKGQTNSYDGNNEFEVTDEKDKADKEAVDKLRKDISTLNEKIDKTMRDVADLVGKQIADYDKNMQAMKDERAATRRLESLKQAYDMAKETAERYEERIKRYKTKISEIDENNDTERMLNEDASEIPMSASQTLDMMNKIASIMDKAYSVIMNVKDPNEAANQLKKLSDELKIPESNLKASEVLNVKKESFESKASAILPKIWDTSKLERVQQSLINTIQNTEKPDSTTIKYNSMSGSLSFIVNRAAKLDKIAKKIQVLYNKSEHFKNNYKPVDQDEKRELLKVLGDAERDLKIAQRSLNDTKEKMKEAMDAIKKHQAEQKKSDADSKRHGDEQNKKEEELEKLRKERDEKRQKLKDDYGVTESTTVYELNL